MRRGLILGCLLALLTVQPLSAASNQGEPAYTQKADVVYGRKHGLALTMDVFTPKANAKGAAVIWVQSGGWVSAHNPNFGKSPFVTEMVKRGYTVFAVMH